MGWSRLAGSFAMHALTAVSSRIIVLLLMSKTYSGMLLFGETFEHASASLVETCENLLSPATVKLPLRARFARALL
jgi:hypothetical protein